MHRGGADIGRSPRGAAAPHPADVCAIGILAIVCVTLAVARARGAPVGAVLLAHGGLLAGYATLSIVLARRPHAGWAAPTRAVAVIATMFTLYGTLARVPFLAVPWLADAALERIDRLIFLGASPSLLLDGRLATAGIEALSFFYAAFIPYLYLSIFLGLVGRPPRERDEFITGFALLYALSFLGYLFAPARGPIVELASAFSADLAGGTFHSLVTTAVAMAGGPHGAFPSLHVGASLYACIFDFRHGNPLRGLIYVPLVAMIVAATVALRYHYVIDLIAGAALALLAGHLAGRWSAPAPVRVTDPVPVSAPAGAVASPPERAP